MKQKNIRIAWMIVIVLVLVIAVSIITTSITGNVIKAKTSITGVETYTKDEIDVWMEDIQDDITSLSGGEAIASEVDCAEGEYLVAQSDGSWGCGDVSTSSSSSSPDYDSGWVYVTKSDGVKSFTHELGDRPKNIVLVECGTVNSDNQCSSKEVYIGTGYHDQGYGYVNPVSIVTDSTSIYVYLTPAAWVWGWWVDKAVSPAGYYGWRCDGDADNNCYTGYYRIYAWK